MSELPKSIKNKTNHIRLKNIIVDHDLDARQARVAVSQLKNNQAYSDQISYDAKGLLQISPELIKVLLARLQRPRAPEGWVSYNHRDLLSLGSFILHKNWIEKASEFRVLLDFMTETFPQYINMVQHEVSPPPGIRRGPQSTYIDPRLANEIIDIFREDGMKHTREYILTQFPIWLAKNAPLSTIEEIPNENTEILPELPTLETQKDDNTQSVDVPELKKPQEISLSALKARVRRPQNEENQKTIRSERMQEKNTQYAQWCEDFDIAAQSPVLNANQRNILQEMWQDRAMRITRHAREKHFTSEEGFVEAIRKLDETQLITFLYDSTRQYMQSNGDYFVLSDKISAVRFQTGKLKDTQRRIEITVSPKALVSMINPRYAQQIPEIVARSDFHSVNKECRHIKIVLEVGVDTMSVVSVHPRP